MAYIGSAEDARRIRKQEEEREKQRKEFEERKKLGETNVDGAGLRQFGAGRAEVPLTFCKSERSTRCFCCIGAPRTSHGMPRLLVQVLEAAFKSETVGLVTREEFLNKRNTLKDRLEEEKEREKRRAQQEAAGDGTPF